MEDASSASTGTRELGQVAQTSLRILATLYLLTKATSLARAQAFLFFHSA